MIVLICLAPLLVIALLSTVWRYPVFILAWVGVAIVLSLITLLPSFNTSLLQIMDAAQAAGIITLQAMFVICPGLYLNELLKQRQMHKQLIDWVNKIPISPLHKSLFVIVGLAPALESLTGFGVSLLVTVPLLLSISDRPIALRQAMLSMNIMPWGTLGLATVVGAQLSGQSVPALGFTTSLVSFGIFPVFGMLVGWFSTERVKRSQSLRDGFLLGCMLSLGLVALNAFGIVELAGILSGLLSALACMLLFRTSNHSPLPPWHTIRPYVIVLGLVVIIRALPFLGVPTKQWAIEAGGVRFAPLASPGFALLVASQILGGGYTVFPMLRSTFNRAMKPILALGGFTLMAQMMVVSGMIRIIGGSLPVSHPIQMGVLSTLLGSLSGYLTGSNVGGNALMMTMQVSLTEDKTLRLALSAIQNSAAGHSVFASMPILLLVLAISGTENRTEESDLVRFGLKILLISLMVLIASGLLIIVIR